MKKLLCIFGILAAIIVAVSCHKNIPAPQGKVSLILPDSTISYFTGVNSYQNLNSKFNDKATLGRVLFYDSHLSINNTISCGSCHKQESAFADNVPLSVGFDGRLTKRNSIGLRNLVSTLPFYDSFSLVFATQPFFWDGRENILANLSLRPMTNHVEMGIMDPRTLPAKIEVLPYYKNLFYKAFLDSNITTDRITECLSVFMASIVSSNSKFETLNGNIFSLSSLEQQGYNLFTGKYNCNACHNINGNVYSDSSFMDIGLDESYTDLGQGAVTGNTHQNGKFHIPSLFNVALTAPYMHDGRYKTLDDVLEHYSHGIKPSANLSTVLRDPNTGQALQMNISEEEKVALKAFLNTLTDYTTVLDPKFSNPFKVNN